MAELLVVVLDHTIFAAAARETIALRGPDQPEFPPGDLRYPALSSVETLLHPALSAREIDVVSTMELRDLGLSRAQPRDASDAQAVEKLRKSLDQGFEGCFESVPPDSSDVGGRVVPELAAALRVLDADYLVTAHADLIGSEDALGVTAVLTPRTWLTLANQLIQ